MRCALIQHCESQNLSALNLLLINTGIPLKVQKHAFEITGGPKRPTGRGTRGGHAYFPVTKH